PQVVRALDDVPSPPVGGLPLGAVGGAAGGHGQQLRRPRVVGVEDGVPGALDEEGLVGEVLLHRPVEVEVLPGEVRPDGDVEVDAAYAVQGQRVAGGLDDGVRRGVVDHLAQDLLDLRRLGGGEVGGRLTQHAVGQLVADR